MLTTEQRIWIVRVYCSMYSLKKVKKAFEIDFPNTTVPSKTTIIRLVNKFFATGSRVEEMRALVEQIPQTSILSLPSTCFHK